MTKPQISVIMSVYNGERYLRESVDSILNQIFTDFEFIIIDDGSTDGTWAILNSYADPRVRLVHNQKNIGLTCSLNKGLALASGEYVARQDADDVSLAERLEQQVRYLDIHPEVGLLGTGCWNLLPSGKQQSMVLPQTDMGIRWYLLFGTVLMHPTVVFRRRLVEQVGGYDPTIRVTQDYELWCRFAQVTRVANLPDRFVVMRVGDPGRISATHLQEQWESNCQTSAKWIRRLLGQPEFDLERARSLCALVFLDPACGTWNFETACDLGLILAQFLTRYEAVRRSSQHGRGRREIVAHLGALCSHHIQPNSTAEDWRISRYLLATMLRLRLPIMTLPNKWRLLGSHALGFHLTRCLRNLRRRASRTRVIPIWKHRKW